MLDIVKYHFFAEKLNGFRPNAKRFGNTRQGFFFHPFALLDLGNGLLADIQFIGFIWLKILSIS